MGAWNKYEGGDQNTRPAFEPWYRSTVVVILLILPQDDVLVTSRQHATLTVMWL